MWTREYYTGTHLFTLPELTRRNKEVKRLLRVHLVDMKHKKWAQQCLLQVLLAIWHQVNHVVGYSPAELFHGWQINRIGDWGLPRQPDMDHSTTDERYHQHQSETNQMRTEATTRMLEQAEQEAVEGELIPSLLVYGKTMCWATGQKATMLIWHPCGCGLTK